jgi:hypothetical protein
VVLLNVFGWNLFVRPRNEWLDDFFFMISFLHITNDYNNPSLYAENQYPLRKDEGKGNRKCVLSFFLKKDRVALSTIQG